MRAVLFAPPHTSKRASRLLLTKGMGLGSQLSAPPKKGCVVATAGPGAAELCRYRARAVRSPSTQTAA